MVVDKDFRDAQSGYQPLPKKETKPAAVKPAESKPTTKSATLTKEYDPIFEKYRGNLPLDFLRAFAYLTSGLNPSKSQSGAAGLFGLSLNALDSYNKANNESNPSTALADPILNTKIAVWILQKIVNYYAANYPKTMYEQWSNPNYVALIIHGYNVGYSEPKGLGAAIKKFNDNPSKLSIDTVAQMSKELGLSANASNPAWITYAKNVASLYLNTPRQSTSPIGLPTAKAPGGGGGGLGIAALLSAGVLAMTIGEK